MTIIDQNTFTAESVHIDPLATQDEWASIHRAVILCRQASGKWLKQSRAFGISKWGEEYVADAEVQMELALGIETSEKPATLNAPDKSKSIVTIEGIAQSFSLWHRKMADEMHEWDIERINRGIELLEEQARVHAELVAMRESMRGEG
jgi:hypothetical protein